jgi:hypothetical protein
LTDKEFDDLNFYISPNLILWAWDFNSSGFYLN